MMDWLNPTPVFVEFGARRLRAWRAGAGVEAPLERGADGRLTAACRESLVSRLQLFLERKPWQPPVPAWCGLEARGVSVRRLSVPVAPEANLESVLRLQIEAEWPLSPEALAWGWREISRTGGQCEVLVVGVRKETVDDYSSLLLAAGMKPEFTVSALARNVLVTPAEPAHLIIEAEAEGLELVRFEHGAPLTARLLPGNSAVETVVSAAAGGTVYLSGPAADSWADQLARRVTVRRLDTGAGEGRSAATAGLERLAGQPADWLGLKFRPAAARLAWSWQFSWREHRRSLIRLGGLALLLLLLPYAETLVLKPMLVRKVEQFQKEQQQYTTAVNADLDFMRDYKESQPPYLDTLYLMAGAAPGGAHLDSVALDRRGAVALKGVMPNAMAMMEFRQKLIQSGFFTNLTVEEQSPTPDRVRVNFRLSAQCLPAAARPKVKVELPNPGTNNNPTPQP